MLFKKTYGELVQQALYDMRNHTIVTNTNVGGITRSLIEVINKNISEYYDILDINMAMGFLSTSEGYFLDLIASLFNMYRTSSSKASASQTDAVQKFYVATGTLMDKIPTGVIPSGTTVTSSDGSIRYFVSAATIFSAGDTEVYVPIESMTSGSQYNVPLNILVTHNLGVSDVFTTNEKAIVNGTDIEADSNFKFRISNATLSAEKANETAIRLAALSVTDVGDAIIKPFVRGIGTYDVIVLPLEGMATDTLIANVQTAIDSVTAVGIKGTARKPEIVPVDITVSLVFTNDSTPYEQNVIKDRVQTAIQQYIVNITMGSSFILNELRQRIMDVSPKIKDHIINCYYFRNEPVFMGNYDIYWDEVFYPNPNTLNAIIVL